MESYGFFDARLIDGQYDRVYNADQHAQYFASFIGNGVFKYSPILDVVESPTPGLSVTLTKGQAWINGYWYKNDEEFELPISLPDPSLPRIDAIAIRWSSVTRDIRAVVLNGTPASNPIAPTPVRDAVTYDLILAHIRVNASALRITNENIVDTRLDFDICGFVYALIDRGEEASIERMVQKINETAVFYPVTDRGEKIIPPSNKSLVSDGRGGVKWGAQYEEVTLNVSFNAQISDGSSVTYDVPCTAKLKAFSDGNYIYINSYLTDIAHPTYTKGDYSIATMNNKPGITVDKGALRGRELKLLYGLINFYQKERDNNYCCEIEQDNNSFTIYSAYWGYSSQAQRYVWLRRNIQITISREPISMFNLILGG